MAEYNYDFKTIAVRSGTHQTFRDMAKSACVTNEELMQYLIYTQGVKVGDRVSAVAWGLKHSGAKEDAGSGDEEN